MSLAAGFAALSLTACVDDSTMLAMLTTSMATPADDTCLAGGVVIQHGLDMNGDGQLDPTEVTSTETFCGGGSTQLAAATPLVRGQAGAAWIGGNDGTLHSPDHTPVVEATDAQFVGTCHPARWFGAIPDDHLDDRAQLQAANDACAGHDIILEDGQYDSALMPTRGFAQLALTGRLVGTGRSRIQYTGDAGGRDWWGISMQANDTAVTGVILDDSAVTGTIEQNHLVHIDGRRPGPLSRIRVAYNQFIHPLTAGRKNGDCVDVVGYEPDASGAGDARIWDLEIDHNEFFSCARSDVTWFSGIHRGKFHDNRSYSQTPSGGQHYDGEGKGGGSHGVEIHHNWIALGQSRSSIWLEVQASSEVRVHDNTGDGPEGALQQGIMALGCSACELDHMRTVTAGPQDGAAWNFRKTGGPIAIHDVYIESSSSVMQLVFQQNAPNHVTIADSVLVQRATGALIAAYGIIGLKIQHSTLRHAGPPIALYAVDVSGSSPLGAGIRGDITVSDTTILGAAGGVRVNGAYAGMGAVSIERSSSPTGTLMLLCDNVALTATMGGIAGPLTYSGNTSKATGCDSVPRPQTN